MLVHRCKWSVVCGVFTKVHSLFGGGGRANNGYHVHLKGGDP